MAAARLLEYGRAVRARTRVPWWAWVVWVAVAVGWWHSFSWTIKISQGGIPWRPIVLPLWLQILVSVVVGAFAVGLVLLARRLFRRCGG